MGLTVAEFPRWNSVGVLPPVRPDHKGHSPERSPYSVSLLTLVERFSSSPERIKILQGFLSFRACLHELGITSGFQWLDGSFMEQVELLEDRPPNDIDVVTFFELPEGQTQRSLVEKNSDAFKTDYLKSTFLVDGYFTQLGQSINQQQVKNITYWYSMWSHRRDSVWKGFIQVNLDPAEDADAQQMLAQYGGDL